MPNFMVLLIFERVIICTPFSFVKIKFSFRCSHVMRPNPTHQIFNREVESRLPMEKLFRKSTAGSAHLFPAAWDDDT